MCIVPGKSSNNISSLSHADHHPGLNTINKFERHEVFLPEVEIHFKSLIFTGSLEPASSSRHLRLVMVNFISKALFGGAILVDLPQSFIDVRLVIVSEISTAECTEMRRDGATVGNLEKFQQMNPAFARCRKCIPLAQEAIEQNMRDWTREPQQVDIKQASDGALNCSPD